ncbi:MAG: Sec-independent protein translocase TatA [Planctomyces sp.]|nr:Sec-independent protein translocase TatA [Planctomyces sp.]
MTTDPHLVTPALGFFLPNLGWAEMLGIGIVMLLLFGRRLPEVGRSLGQGIVEFKKGLRSIDQDVEQASAQPARSPGSGQSPWSPPAPLPPAQAPAAFSPAAPVAHPSSAQAAGDSAAH